MKVVGFDRSSNFAIGSGGLSLSKDQILDCTDSIIAWSGVGHIDIYNHIRKNNLDFFYIDTGYFGNNKHKTYKRITFNGLNDNQIIKDRPTDRLQKLSLEIKNIPRGDSILIIPPDQKVLNCWDSETLLDQWKHSTYQTIKNFTDRPIIFRERIKSRTDRLIHNTFSQALHENIHAVIVWSSNCAVESILHGIPVISLGPTATRQISPFSIQDIDQVPKIPKDLVQAWVQHLSYCQYTEEEMLSGLAWEYLRP